MDPEYGSYPSKRFPVRTYLLNPTFRSCNYTWKEILLLQINAQHPSRLTKLIMLKCFLGRLIPCNWCLSPSILDILTFYKIENYIFILQIKGLLVTNIA
jgi:hypothetical protein